MLCLSLCSMYVIKILLLTHFFCFALILVFSYETVKHLNCNATDVGCLNYLFMYLFPYHHMLCLSLCSMYVTKSLQKLLYLLLTLFSFFAPFLVFSYETATHLNSNASDVGRLNYSFMYLVPVIVSMLCLSLCSMFFLSLPFFLSSAMSL